MDFDGDLDDFRMGTIVKQRLLRAVSANVIVGGLGECRVRGEQGDRRDVRTGFGDWEIPGIVVQEMKESLIVALAEEIGFANGFIGERSIVGEEIERKQKPELKCDEAGNHDKLTVAQNRVCGNAKELVTIS